jgi:hypothetical protein
MGTIKTSQQKSGSYLLEITYGGVDAPFGGIDTSKPPAYIDPRCFVDSDGFLIADNKVCVASFQAINMPTLWSGTQGITLLGVGTFFNAYTLAENLQFNYALGYIATPFGEAGVTATGQNYTFYMTVWNPSNPTDALTTYNDVLNYSLFDASIPATASSITLGAIGTGVAGTSYNIVLTVTGPGGTNTYTVAGASLTSQTPGAAVTAMVAAITADPNVTAAASLDGLSIVLTSIATGSVSNSISVQDTSSTLGGVVAPGFYFPARTGSYLEGGANVTGAAAPVFLGPASIVAVGGVLYIGNIGPVILQYSGPETFQISTVYTGVNQLAKFEGALVGLGVIPQLGTVTQDKDMIFVWSATTQLSEWAPETSAGNVTGAGFSQLADIGDALTGLVVSNNTAWVIRQQGLTYVTATGNGTSPYNFANVSLGNRGEGCQLPSLVCQYDAVGMYISNTNVVQLAQSPTPMGDKIKNTIFQFLETLPDPPVSLIGEPTEVYPYLTSSNACGVSIGGTEDVLYAFLLGQEIYFADGTNGSWMKMSYSIPTAPLYLTQAYMSVLSNSGLSAIYGFAANAPGFSQGSLCIAEGIYSSTTGTFTTPALYTLVEGIAPANSSSPSTNNPYVLFPVEEIAYGRDITLDGLYVSILAYVPEGGVGITFTIYGQVLVNGVSEVQVITETTLTITAAEFPNPITPTTVPTEFQLFSNQGSFTVRSPQLKYSLVSDSTSTCQIELTKISMFGSFDPNQRPV